MIAAMKSLLRFSVLAFVSVLTACGGSDASQKSSSGGGGTPTPTVSLSASPASISAGGTSTLTWSSTNATTCAATGSWSGTKAASGTEISSALNANATFSLSCTGAGGTAQASTSVTVTSSTPAPTVTISASPTSVASGAASTLTWSTTNATTCTASGAWSGTKATSGTSVSTGALTANSTFTLSCTGAGGTGQGSASVSVTGTTPAPTVTLSAAPTSVASGGTATLTWTTTNATSCTASGGWSGTKATAGTATSPAITTATTFTLSCTGAGGTAQNSVTVSIVGSTGVYPLHVDSSKRYLLDAQNRPFLITGDSPWSLIAELNDADAETYLETRRQQGFNTVMVNLIEHKFADNAPKDAAGDAPFTGEAFSTPNEAYFAHAETIISKANSKGMLVLLAPAYMGYQGGDEGWYQEMTAVGATKLRTYGQYVANRFKSYDNIIWVEGGDYDPPEKNLLRAVANGIKDVDTPGKWLQTFHGGRGTGALEFLSTTSDPWLTLNNIYTDTATVVSEARGQYSGSTMPFFLIEAGYESGTAGGDTDGAGVRAQAYQAVLSGSTGQMMGNWPVWYFGSGWQSALTKPAAATIGHLPELLNSSGISWWTLVPDTAGTVLTSAPGSGIDRQVATRAADGSVVLAYTTGAAMTIDMTKLAGPTVTARWFDPSTGSFTTITGSPFANTGSKTFTPSGSHSGGGSDFVLVLQSP